MNLQVRTVGSGYMKRENEEERHLQSAAFAPGKGSSARTPSSLDKYPRREVETAIQSELPRHFESEVNSRPEAVDCERRCGLAPGEACSECVPAEG